MVSLSLRCWLSLPKRKNPFVLVWQDVSLTPKLVFTRQRKYSIWCWDSNPCHPACNKLFTPDSPVPVCKICICLAYQCLKGMAVEGLVHNSNGTNLLIKKAHRRGGVSRNWSSSSFLTIVFVAVPTYRLSNHLYLHNGKCRVLICDIWEPYWWL